MPFTFLAHQAPVLPLKWRWPRMVSGLGLVLGSMAPDFGYFVLGARATRDWHRLHGALLYCLPLSLVLYMLITRLVAAPLARHVPRLGALRLHEWAYLEAQPRTLAHLAIVAASVLAGVATHLAWDLFTHEGSWMGGYVPFLADALMRVRGHDVRGSNVLWFVSTAVGGLYTLHFLHAVGRRGLLREWAEERLPGSTAAITPSAPARLSTISFWGPVAVLTVFGAISSYVTRPEGFFWYEKATWIMVFLRTTSLAAIGLAISAWRERRAWRHRSSGTGQHGGDRAIDPAA